MQDVIMEGVGIHVHYADLGKTHTKHTQAKQDGRLENRVYASVGYQV
jgi:hypothetical protein